MASKTMCKRRSLPRRAGSTLTVTVTGTAPPAGQPGGMSTPSSSKGSGIGSQPPSKPETVAPSHSVEVVWCTAGGEAVHTGSQHTSEPQSVRGQQSKPCLAAASQSSS